MFHLEWYTVYYPEDEYHAHAIVSSRPVGLRNISLKHPKIRLYYIFSFCSDLDLRDVSTHGLAKGCEILIQPLCDVIERLDHPISFFDSGEVAKESFLSSHLANPLENMMRTTDDVGLSLQGSRILSPKDRSARVLGILELSVACSGSEVWKC